MGASFSPVRAPLKRITKMKYIRDNRTQNIYALTRSTSRYFNYLVKNSILPTESEKRDWLLNNSTLLNEKKWLIEEDEETEETEKDHTAQSVVECDSTKSPEAVRDYN